MKLIVHQLWNGTKPYTKYLIILLILLMLWLFCLFNLITLKAMSNSKTEMEMTKTFVNKNSEDQNLFHIIKTKEQRKKRQATASIKPNHHRKYFSYFAEPQNTAWLPKSRDFSLTEKTTQRPLYGKIINNQLYDIKGYPYNNAVFKYNTDYDNYNTNSNKPTFEKDFQQIQTSTNLQEKQQQHLPPTHSSILNQLKTLWEFHQAFMTIWNIIVEYKQKSMDTAMTEITPTQMTAIETVAQNTTNSKVKREASAPQSTAIAGARYIKNDPLKSYYDFVIMEASHKFWSVFEVITSIIIIYSTFCAIYFSKMNPLVSQHDYTDYIGAEDYIGPPVIKYQPGEARVDTVEGSGSADDYDFEDDVDTSTTSNGQAVHWYYNWLPNAGHSVQFILDAINKIPVEYND